MVDSMVDPWRPNNILKVEKSVSHIISFVETAKDQSL
jgi:hypothetical protein